MRATSHHSTARRGRQALRLRTLSPSLPRARHARCGLPGAWLRQPGHWPPWRSPLPPPAPASADHTQVLPQAVRRRDRRPREALAWRGRPWALIFYFIMRGPRTARQPGLSARGGVYLTSVSTCLVPQGDLLDAERTKAPWFECQKRGGHRSTLEENLWQAPRAWVLSVLSLGGRTARPRRSPARVLRRLQRGAGPEWDVPTRS